MLELIAKDHNKWIEIVNKYGEYDYAEDIVQEMYLRIDKYSDKDRLIYKGQLNVGYIRFTLRNMTFAFHKEKKKVDKFRIGEGFDIEQEENGEAFAYGKFLHSLDRLINSWEPFDRTVFKLYIGTYGTQNVKTHGLKISIRKFAAESGLATMTIFKSLKKSKQSIRENLGEDWQDFMNKDWELL